MLKLIQKLLNFAFTFQEPRPRDVLNGGSLYSGEVGKLKAGDVVECVIPDESNHLRIGGIYSVQDTKDYDYPHSHVILSGFGYTGGESTYSHKRFVKW